jgi:SAM-dependent methyltransferase
VAVADYDEIGVGYARHRQPDPRLAAQFERALGEASTVLNVGAGTGSYESVDRAVVAVEPSAVMAAQRPAGAAPVLRAVVEQLPFAGETFDAATMFLTLHHWADWRVGLREVQRVARRLVIFTFEPGAHAHCWVVRDYLPAAGRTRSALAPHLDEVVQALPESRVEVVPVPHDCTDGFLWAYWRRPDQYLDPAVRRGISAIAQLPPQEVEPGMARLAADLESGRWHDEHADLLDLDEVDGGFRLVVAG